MSVHASQLAPNVISMN